MAVASVTYPKISKKLWFLVRDRFKQSIPTAVTPTLVISLSQMEEGSARSNVISPLRDLGLLDENNKPTQLAERWRHDDEYASVCHEIRATIYPGDLVEAFPAADSTKKEPIKRWFMKMGQVGEVAADMYANTYILLSQADLSKSEEKTVPKPPSSKGASFPRKPKAVQSKLDTVVPDELRKASTESGAGRRMPSVHIDVQVHISPDTSPEQIDRIFESMAKHLGSHIK